MATLDTRPQIVDITCLGGDTLTIIVNAPFALTQGKEWLAQVRLSRDAPTVDATFTITPSTADGTPSYVMLPAADTARLAGTGVVVSREIKNLMGRVSRLASIQQYVGVYDVQISAAGGADPVNTLAQGTLTIEMDVSRVAAA